MFSTYTVVEAYKDPSQIRLPGPEVFVHANRNLIAVLEFVNDEDPEDVHRYYANGDDLTDARIDAQARNIIASLNAQATALTALTIGQVQTPKTSDPKLDALTAAQKDFQKKSVASMVKFRNDPDELAAYATLVAAQEAVAQT